MAPANSSAQYSPNRDDQIYRPEKTIAHQEGLIEQHNIPHKSKAVVAKENELEWVDITCSTMKTGRASWADEMENAEVGGDSAAACRRNKANEDVVEPKDVANVEYTTAEG
ncbi:hypothetical protein K7X08_005211 [Anisodus acutangulus]|uniref:Uncharacterized protein n=1 Tax=Anisodus acutangulus TaxID=402998 RepID=A0A9Q1MFE4_9SOLA|nr:hypothetical protein K7X08_005211 [Anisodus acutangulus]